jgi:SAM-dependent methyltransferase
MRLLAVFTLAALTSCAAAQTSPTIGASIADAQSPPVVPALSIDDAGAPPPIPVADAGAPATASVDLDVVYWVTPQPVVDKMLEIAEINPSDVVYDLGCGDGRILVTAAARYGARGFGFDKDPRRVRDARENARQHGVDHLVQVEQADIFTVDLSPADVVFLFLLPALNVRLMPQLKKLHRGSRIVSHEFDMAGARPKRVVRVHAPPDGPPVYMLQSGTEMHTVYLWEVPWQKHAKAK